ncbi:MAG: ferritin-like domain-containing protein [Ferruginibacter sp.]
MAKTSKQKTTVKTTEAKMNMGTSTLEGQFKPEFASSLEDLFISELKDTFWAENHLVKSLPKMIAAAGAPDLKQALTEHLEITKMHSSRLADVLTTLGEDIVAKKCDAMEGLTISGEHVIENTMAGTETRDTALIMSGLKVENFEITTYTGLVKTATKLGRSDIAEILQQTLNEEIDAANTLATILDSGTTL